MHHKLYLFDTLNIGKPKTIHYEFSAKEESILLYPLDIDIVNSIELVSPIVGRAPPVYGRI